MSEIDSVAMQRLLWRCRRGLLELDLVLGKFVRESYAQLSQEQRVIFDELLDMPDTQLWDLVTGQKEPAEARHGQVLEKLKAI